tara:strand:+ start:1992 stop:3317 length:1326 start_codon:yes stop_codon:yes gene_type:complete
MNMKRKNKITIIGGGPAGISCAYYANKHNIDFVLFESSDSLGGNCQTIKYQDFYFDTGAHRLHDKDAETTQLIKQLLGQGLKKINVPSQIFRDNKFIDFPLSPISLLYYLGYYNFIKEAFRIIFGLLFKCNQAKNFHEFAVSRFGYTIAQLFLLDYSKKLWGLDSKNLSISVSGNRLKGLSLYTMVLEFLFGNKVKTKHLDGAFYYPDFGIGSIFDALVKLCGPAHFHTNSKVTALNHSNNRINSIEINNDRVIQVEELVSTMPLSILLDKLNPKPPKNILAISKSIKFRNIVLICFFLKKDSINSNGSMYFPDEKYLFTRVYEPKNRSRHMSPLHKTSLIVEVPCQSTDDIWCNSANLISKVKNDLIDIGFFADHDIIDSCEYKIHHAYPILELGFEKKLDSILTYLETIKNLKISGRNGLFQYSHIHDHMKNAREIFRF